MSLNSTVGTLENMSNPEQMTQYSEINIPTTAVLLQNSEGDGNSTSPTAIDVPTQIFDFTTKTDTVDDDGSQTDDENNRDTSISLIDHRKGADYSISPLAIEVPTQTFDFTKTDRVNDISSQFDDDNDQDSSISLTDNTQFSTLVQSVFNAADNLAAAVRENVGDGTPSPIRKDLESQDLTIELPTMLTVNTPLPENYHGRPEKQISVCESSTNTSYIQSPTSADEIDSSTSSNSSFAINGKHLSSFNITTDESREAVDYYDLLRTFNIIFEKYRSSERERKRLLEELEKEKKKNLQEVEVLACLYHQNVSQTNNELLQTRAKNDSLLIQMKVQEETCGQLKEHKIELLQRLKEEENNSSALKEHLISEKDHVKELEEIIASNGEATNLLEDNITQLRDENTKLRNNLKLMKQNEVESASSDGIKLRADLKNFKKEIMAEISSLKKNITPVVVPQATQGINNSSSDVVICSEDEELSTGRIPIVPGLHSYSEALTTATTSTTTNTLSTAHTTPTSLLQHEPPQNAAQHITDNAPMSPGERDSTARTPRNSMQNNVEHMRERRNQRERKTVIFASSMTRGINKANINEECTKGKIIFHEFKAKKARDIVRYIDTHLLDDQPHSVMFICGGNDLPNDAEATTATIEAVANKLIDAGLRCKNEFGVSEVFISSILPRNHSCFQINRYRLNNLLRSMCYRHKFNFIENKGINLSHIISDGTHLNKRGSDVLSLNIIDNISDK